MRTNGLGASTVASTVASKVADTVASARAEELRGSSASADAPVFASSISAALELALAGPVPPRAKGVVVGAPAGTSPEPSASDERAGEAAFWAAAMPTIAEAAGVATSAATTSSLEPGLELELDEVPAASADALDESVAEDDASPTTPAPPPVAEHEAKHGREHAQREDRTGVHRIEKAAARHADPEHAEPSSSHAHATHAPAATSPGTIAPDRTSVDAPVAAPLAAPAPGAPPPKAAAPIASAPIDPSPSAELETPYWVDVRAVDRAVVHVDDASLGALAIQVRAAQGGVHVEVLEASAHAATVLRATEESLRAAFRARGSELRSIRVIPRPRGPIGTR